MEKKHCSHFVEGQYSIFYTKTISTQGNHACFEYKILLGGVHAYKLLYRKWLRPQDRPRMSWRRLHLPAILETCADLPGGAKESCRVEEGAACVVLWSLLPSTSHLLPNTHTLYMARSLLLRLKQRSGIKQWQVVDFHLHVYSCAQVISLLRSGNYSYPRAQNSPSVWNRRIRSSRGHSDNLLDNTNIIIITFCCLHVCLILFMTEIQFQLNKTINFFWLLHRYNLE